MAGKMDSSVSGEDLDAILTALEDNLLDQDEDFCTQINDITDEIGENQPSCGFSCDHCDKVCKTQRGLTRHTNTKHALTLGDVIYTGENETTPESMLHPSYFKKFVEDSVSKLSGDECYSLRTRNEFLNYNVNIDDISYTYQFVRDVIGKFKGEGEKFYPEFYKCVSGEEIVFRNLSRRSSVFLGFEVANHVLAYLTGSTIKENNVDFSVATNFSKKENNIISYLSGYVFSTLYRRIKRSKSCQSMLGLQSLSILLAGKSTLEDSSEVNVLINAKDRGGLWKVIPQVVEIFATVEKHFRESTKIIGRNIDSKTMVSTLIKNSYILSNYTTIRDLSTEKVSKEVALNLLENLIMLYVRVRVFSLVKDNRELHKMEAKKKKLKSLRTEIKKASQSLEKGH